MSVIIKLRNGRELEAQTMPDGTFEAKLASGKIKIYGVADVVSVTTENNPNNIIIPKEDPMKMYHYLLKQQFNKDTEESFVGITRVVTNKLPVSLAECYNTSLETKLPSEYVFAINSGNWMFHLLNERLTKKNIEFKVYVIKNDVVAKFNEDEFDFYVERSTFCYANASYTFFLRIEGTKEFGLKAMGITIDHSKKSAKRLQELFRQTEMYLYLEGDEAMDTVDFIFPELDMSGDREKFYDGKTYIRKSFAIRMAMGVADPSRRMKLMDSIKCGKLTQVVIRIMTPNGLLKGDAIIVPNKNLDADVSTAVCNLKNELLTDGYMFACMWEHSMVHMAVWDDQSAINFGHALPEKAQTGDVMRLVKNIEMNINNGTLPEWLELGEAAHGDDGLVDVEKLSETINKSWIRWQAHNLDVRGAQNLTYMALNGVIKRMSRSAKVNGFHKKMWIPMTNACLLTINTWESARRMGNMSFPGFGKDKAFFDPRAGFVLSGQRFVETYNLHGGWDLDDAMKVIIVKVWCSDQDKLMQHIGKTVPNTFIPGKEEDAKEMVLLVRSPNGPGEWSIEECHIDTLPIPADFRHNDVTVVDIAKMPLPQDLLLDKVQMSGMPTGMTFSNTDMTKDNCVEMIKAQLINPGVGTYCNPMMVWASAREGFPAHMLAPMETIVDTLQQEHDRDKFLAVAAECESITSQLLATGVSIDKALANTRMSLDARIQVNMVEGRFTRVQKAYAQAINTIQEKLMKHTLQMRRADSTVKAVQSMTFGQTLFGWAGEFYSRFNFQMALVDGRFQIEVDDNPFAKMSKAAGHKAAMEEVVTSVVNVLDSIQDPTMSVLALWKFATSSDRNHLLGRSDRIIFQPNKLGER